MGLRSRCYFRTVKARGVCEPQEEAYSNAASQPPLPHRPRQTHGQAHHVPTHAHTLSHTHSHRGELWSTCRHANAHGPHKQADALQNTDMHAQPPKQDPAQRPPPESTHAQTLSLSKPPRITAWSHTSKLEGLSGPFGPTPTNALMRKPRPKQGKAFVHDAPPLKETKFIHFLHCVGCTHILHSLICLTPSLNVVNPFLLQAPESTHLPSPHPSPNPSLPFHSPCHLPAPSHYLMPRI